MSLRSKYLTRYRMVRNRRHVGVKHAQARSKNTRDFSRKGLEIKTAELNHVQDEVANLQAKLQEFALKHKKKINQDPSFRMHFNEMCQKIGMSVVVGGLLFEKGIVYGICVYDDRFRIFTFPLLYFYNLQTLINHRGGSSGLLKGVLG